MTIRIACVLPVVALLAAAAPAEPDKAPAALQGAWRLTSVATDGEAILPALPDPRPVLVIKGDKLIYGGEEIAHVAADPATDPKVIDLKFASPERVYEGIYSIEKDTLKVCLNGRSEGAKERPTSLSVKDHPARRLLTFERAKAEDAGGGTGFVGVSLRFDADTNEVIVNAPLDNTPASKAGLRKDDVVLQVGGAKVADLQLAIKAVRAAKPKSDLVLRIRRGDKEQDVTVKVALLPFGILAGLE
jgi:uncharacterized protein (TIGR03067 family)